MRLLYRKMFFIRICTKIKGVNKMKAKKFDLVGYIIAYENGELTDRKTLDLFSELIRTGQAWSLQGHYGRTAQAIIDSGWINSKGEINYKKVEENALVIVFYRLV